MPLFCDHILKFKQSKDESLKTKKGKVITSDYNFKFCPDCGKKLMEKNG